MRAPELHAEDCTVREFVNSHAAGVLLGPRTRATFTTCAFYANTLLPPRAGDAGIAMFGAALAARSNATALFQDCSFRQNVVLAADGVSVMETDPTPKTVSAAGGPAAAVVAAAPPGLEVWDYTAGAGRRADAWTGDISLQAESVEGLRAIQTDFVRAFQEAGGAAALGGAAAAEADTAPPDGGGGGGGGRGGEYRTMVVVLASVLGSLLIAIILVTAVAVRQWRRVAHPFFSVRPSWSNGPSSCRDVLVDEASRDVTSSHTISMNGITSIGMPGSLGPQASSTAGPPLQSPRRPEPLPPTPAINGPSWDPSNSASAIQSAAPSAAPSSDIPHTPRAYSSRQSSRSFSNTIATNDISIFRAGTTGRSKGIRSRAVSVLSNVIGGITGRTSSVRGGDTSRSLTQTAQVDQSVVEGVLDVMVATEVPFLMQYMLEGPPTHRRGSRGLVQFAKSRVTGQRVAIKFFLDENAFRCEEAAHAQPQLKPLMESLVMINSNEARVPTARQGAAVESLPPCVIYEAAEPLDAWLVRARPDLLTSVHILCSIAERVAAIHDTGFVHRDLKPSNIMWRREHGTWTIVDFGCAAPMGYMTKITDSKVYVPPETLFAHSVSAHSVSVDAAADVWAVGVLMLECFSGTPSAAAHAPVATFVPGGGTATVAGGTSSIASAASGPVEDDAARLTRALFERLEHVSLPRIYGAPVTAAVANELRALRLKMAGCLAREPVRRPSIKQLVATLQKTRDALQVASAANVWMPHDVTNAPAPLPKYRPAAGAAAAAPAAAPSAEAPTAASPPVAPVAAPVQVQPDPPAAAPAAADVPVAVPAAPREEAVADVASAEPELATPPRGPDGSNAAEELRGTRLTGMLDSDARVAKCEAWVTSMQEVTLDQPTMIGTDDTALDSPPRRATDSMFGRSSGVAGGAVLAADGGSAAAHARSSRSNSGAAGGGAPVPEEPGRLTFTPVDTPAGADAQTRDVTPLVTSPLELKADSTLDSELAGQH